MKRLMFIAMFAVMLFGTVAIGYAEHGDWHGGIRSRIHEARQRIERGVDRGTLTRHEARKLNDELGNIMNKIDRMKADGRLSPGERERINRDLDRLDRDISREKRDGDGRHRDDGHRYR